MRANHPPAAWARLTPLSGTTARETDFVTVRMNLSELRPGIYTDHVTIVSNGGTARIPISLNVTGEPSPKLLPVYRYTRDNDILFTTQPDKEDPRYLGAYQRAGLAFRLYSPGTAGTVELYRWYNPSIGDHYYAAERRREQESVRLPLRADRRRRHDPPARHEGALPVVQPGDKPSFLHDGRSRRGPGEEGLPLRGDRGICTAMTG